MKSLLILSLFFIYTQSLRSDEVALEINSAGQVGINLNGNIPKSGSNLHVKGRSFFENLINLPPLDTSPQNPLQGDIYLDNEGQLLLYFNSTWNLLAQPEPINPTQPASPYLNLEDYTLTFFDATQNHSEDTTQVLVDQYLISLHGNAWRKINFSYEITSTTILEFEFKSTIKGEVHGIGFTNTDSIVSQYTFNLYGTQNWGNSTFRNYASSEGQWKSYSIPIGQYYQGHFNYLFFANDHDQSPKNGESHFRNIKLISNN
jgi:hypothetical protein